MAVFVRWVARSMLIVNTIDMCLMLCTFPLMHRFRGHIIFHFKIVTWAMTSRNIDTVHVLTLSEIIC